MNKTLLLSLGISMSLFGNNLPSIVDFAKLNDGCHIGANKTENWELGHLSFNAAPEIASIMTYLKKSYKIDSVVETGTFQGNTTVFFSYLFDDVHTIELNPVTYAETQNKLSHLNNVSCYKGSSDMVFKNLLPTLKGKTVLFYLDAHWNQYWPLLREIEEIAKTHKDQCVIVIDDAKVPHRNDIPYDKFGKNECSYDYIKEKINLAFSDHTVHYLIPNKKGSKAKLLILPKLSKENL